MRWLDAALQLVLPPVQNNAGTQAKIRSVFYHTRSSFSAIAFKENGSCSYCCRSINSYGCTLSAAFVYDKKTFDVWDDAFLCTFLSHTFIFTALHTHAYEHWLVHLFVYASIHITEPAVTIQKQRRRKRERKRPSRLEVRYSSSKEKYIVFVGNNSLVNHLAHLCQFPFYGCLHSRQGWAQNKLRPNIYAWYCINVVAFRGQVELRTR